MDKDINLLIKIVSTSLKLSKNKINDKSSVKNLEEWDSIGHLSILMALDKHFKGKLQNIDELSECDSIKKIHMVLLKNQIFKK